MLLSLHSDFLMTFNSFFIWLFRDTHLLLFVALRSLVSFYIAQKSDTFLFVVFRSDRIYKYLRGRQRPVIAFSGRRPPEDADWRHS